MELICTLLEVAAGHFKAGNIKAGDQALNIAVRLRKEIEKGTSLVPAKKLDRTSEKS